MNGEQRPEPRQTRGTVLVMPPRGPQPSTGARQSAPPGQDAEPGDEPGYGHGV